MAIERRIIIKTNAPGASPRVSFDPNPLKANPADQIFWTNNDTQPHWPGLSGNPTFFMSNQIAPGGDVSPVFSTVVTGTLTYICTLNGHQNETGTIEISTTPAP